MPSLWPDNGPAEVIEALADALRIANFKGDRLEAKRLFRQLEHEGKAGREAVSPARRLTKFERCKQWLIGLIGTESLIADGLLRGKSSDEASLALELLNSAESHIKRASADGRGKSRMSELTALGDTVAKNQIIALRMLSSTTQVNFLP